ncbi:hypothetical protein TKV_c07970 [Thermoanaerobacter kivui]|uniref:Uncharacterized protein n=1 Tax=Thermoanaerobacter kivui TaxID=2325 RepID=A0A097AQ88_THEKI|nr:lactococcin G-beta/enterocin 1071B family bacteriocin [Thermoanaerobacter kivui]AIS51980.1 hypothetical protein TKV_c07970 [Thermoanaerobacter kivui]
MEASLNQPNSNMLYLTEDELQKINGGNPWETLGKLGTLIGIIDAVYDFGKGFVDGFKAAYARDRDK